MIPIQKRYKAFCLKTKRIPQGEWIAPDTFKISYGQRPPTWHTASAMRQTIPYMFRKSENILSSKVDCVFKDDGYCYLQFSNQSTLKPQAL